MTQIGHAQQIGQRQRRRLLLTISGLSFAFGMGLAVAQNDSGLKRPSPSMPDTSIPDKIAPPEQGVPSPPGTIGRGKDEPAGAKTNRELEEVIVPPPVDPESQSPIPPTGPSTKPANPSPV